jgi:uncharacterized protein
MLQGTKKTRSSLIKIQAIGTYFPKDAEGYILNPCNWTNVPAQYAAVIEDLKAASIARLGASLHAIYLRGSLPRGTAAEGISDLDLVLVTLPNEAQEFIRWKTPEWAEDLLQDLQSRYPYMTAIDLAETTRELAYPGQTAAIKFVLKTQALFIWGQDDAASWPASKPGPATAFNYRWLASELAAWQARSAQPQGAAQPKLLQGLAKTTLRAGFETVMERAQCFAVDLYPCYETFARYYPGQAQDMRAALFAYLNPSAAATDWIDRLLPWLILESQAQLGI